MTCQRKPRPLRQSPTGRLLEAGDRDRQGPGPPLDPADIHLGPRTLVQPDLFVVQLARVGLRAAWKDVPVPLLAIEVRSPSRASHDRGKKRRICLDTGVREYWIVDIDGGLIERWRRGDTRPAIEDALLEWELRGEVKGTVNVSALFTGLGE